MNHPTEKLLEGLQKPGLFSLLLGKLVPLAALISVYTDIISLAMMAKDGQ